VTPARHVPALDGIRGLAVVWVVMHNTTAAVTGRSTGVLYLLTVFAHTGWIGVQLFFALSGFLITAGLLATQGAPHYFRDFYLRRALRILPLYYTVLLLVLVILPRIVTLPAAFSNDHQAPLWLFLTNLTQSVPYGFAHFWSLAVEEQFYVVWPLLVFRLAPRRLLLVCPCVAAGALAVRCLMHLHGAAAWTIYENTACRMDALALGGAGACLLFLPELRERVRRRLGVIGLAALLLFAAGIPLTHVYDTGGLAGQTLGYTLLAVCAAVFVTAAALPAGRAWSAIAALLAWAPLRSCGKYSYAIYVVHNLLHKLLGEPWLTARFGATPPAQVLFGYGLAVLLLSYLIAFVSYHTLEQHFLRLKGRLAPRPAPNAAR
jgi:peptidoglycan/LPS O-acetylase OafA/YrhL